jgi:universal stress protein E
MHPIRRVLVAIKDPEARPSAALKKAAQLARGLDARLELFHAMTSPLYTTPYFYSDRALADLQEQVETRVVQRLQALAGSLASSGRQHPLRLSVAAEWDMPVYEAIIRRALAIKADLIVAEPHHGRRLMPLLHFNDWELLRRSPTPVLLVKRPGRYAHPVVLAAVDPQHRQDRSARLDAAILDLSLIFVHALHGQLHSVHAYQPLPSGVRLSGGLDTETAAELNQRIAVSAEQRFAWLLRRYTLSRQARHLVAMPAVEAIEDTARQTHSAIVTLGVVARGGWRRLLIGRTAELLLDRASCDLLVVKPPDFKIDIPRRPSGPRLFVVPLTP